MRSLLFVLTLVGLASGAYTAPGVVWTSDSLPELYRGRLVVDGSDNIYSIQESKGIFYNGSRIIIRKFSPTYTMLWVDSVEMGVNKFITINKAIVNGSEIVVTGKYTNGSSESTYRLENSDTLFLQRIDLNGKAIGTIPSFKADILTASEGYDIAVKGSTYDIVGIAKTNLPNLHPDTLSHIRIWNTGYIRYGYDPTTVGVSTDSVKRISNFIRTPNGYIISALWGSKLDLLSVDTSYKYRWRSYCGQLVNYPFPVFLKNDTPMVYCSDFAGSTGLKTWYKIKYNGLFYSATAPSPQAPVFIKSYLYDLTSVVSDPYGVFLFGNNMCVRVADSLPLWSVAIPQQVSFALVIPGKGTLIFSSGSARRRLYALDREGIASITHIDTFSMIANGSLPTPQKDTITNINTAVFGPLTSSIAYGPEGTGWLTTTITGTGNTQPVTNTISHNNLPAGIYTATVSLSGNYLKAASSYQVVLKVTTGTGVVTPNQAQHVSGIWATRQGVRFQALPGPYEITAHDLSGRLIYSQKGFSEGSPRMIPLTAHQVYVVRLRQGATNNTIIRTCKN